MRMVTIEVRCICNTGPGTDGPSEDCPAHGRDYSWWVEGAELLQARISRVRALGDSWVGFDNSHYYGDLVLKALMDPPEKALMDPPEVRDAVEF